MEAEASSWPLEEGNEQPDVEADSGKKEGEKKPGPSWPSSSSCGLERLGEELRDTSVMGVFPSRSEQTVEVEPRGSEAPNEGTESVSPSKTPRPKVPFCILPACEAGMRLVCTCQGLLLIHNFLSCDSSTITLPVSPPMGRVAGPTMSAPGPFVGGSIMAPVDMATSVSVSTLGPGCCGVLI